MPQVRVDGVSLHYEERGSGEETVVFSHGLLMSHRMYDAQMAALCDRYRCIAYDHRGQGASEAGAEPSISIETVYDDAVALIEALDAAPCHFVGLSMGGFVGMRIAARRPELLRTLTLIDTAAGPEPRPNLQRYRMLNTALRVLGSRPFLVRQILPTMFGRTWLGDPTREDERQRWTQHLRSLPRTTHRAVHGVITRASFEHELGGIAVPTLVLHGDEDQAIPVERGRRLAASIPAARFVLVERAGHSSTIEQAGTVSAALAEHIARA